MPSQKNEKPSVNTANTKKEILEAYHYLLERFNEQAKAERKAEHAANEKKEKEVVATADASGNEDVLRKINGLKGTINSTLSELAEKLADTSRTYTHLTEAIAIKQKELKELFDIETSAYSLVALVEAQKLKRAEFEEEMSGRREQLEDDINRTRDQWEKDKQIYQQQVKEQKTEDQKLRQREKEEYTYAFNREKEMKTQQLADNLEKLEKELRDKQDVFDKETARKEEELLQRENALSQKETTLADLRDQVDAFPGELETRITKAVDEALSHAQQDAHKNEQLLLKGFEGEKNVLITKIESLEKLAASRQDRIATLSAQLDNAYGKVQDIAVKAVYRDPAPQHRHSRSDENDKRA